jgi:F-type H+-transporting ATPase subunit b
MPQFEFATVFWPQLIWLTLIFAVLFFGVVMPTLPKIARVVDERESKVAGDLGAAETAKASADALAGSYSAGIAEAQTAARAALFDAKAKAAKSSEIALTAANVAIDAKLAAADITLASAKLSALAEIDTIASDASSDIVEKLTGKRPLAAAVQAAVQSARVQG